MVKQQATEEAVNVLEGQTCPTCMKKTLTLMEYQRDIPFFGPTFFFSMDCTHCGYHKADLESAEKRDPVKYTLDITEESDLKARVVKSANATIKIPHIGEIEGSETSNGYVTNVEGILNRLKKITEDLRDNTEDKSEQTKAKNILKKIGRILWGRDKAKLILQDPAGNSAVISDKAKKEKLKK